MSKALYKAAEGCNYLTVKEMTEVFNMSQFMVDKIAKRCGAKVKIDYMTRYRRDVFQNYLNSLTMDPEQVAAIVS